MKKRSIFLTIFFFSLFFCTLKYVNMIRISNISFFRFCWKNRKLDWPKCARTIFESFFCCSKNHLPKACVHGFIRYCPSYCRAFTTKLMGLPVAKLEARKERSSLQPKHLDRQYLQDKQVLLDQFRKNRSTNSGTQFGIDFFVFFFV